MHVCVFPVEVAKTWRLISTEHMEMKAGYMWPIHMRLKLDLLIDGSTEYRHIVWLELHCSTIVVLLTLARALSQARRSHPNLGSGSGPRHHPRCNERGLWGWRQPLSQHVNNHRPAWMKQLQLTFTQHSELYQEHAWVTLNADRCAHSTCGHLRKCEALGEGLLQGRADFMLGNHGALFIALLTQACLKIHISLLIFM